MKEKSIDLIEISEKINALYAQVNKGIDTYTELEKINKDNYMKHNNRGTLTALNVMQRNMQILFKDVLND